MKGRFFPLRSWMLSCSTSGSWMLDENFLWRDLVVIIKENTVTASSLFILGICWPQEIWREDIIWIQVWSACVFFSKPCFFFQKRPTVFQRFLRFFFAVFQWGWCRAWPPEDVFFFHPTNDELFFVFFFFLGGGGYLTMLKNRTPKHRIVFGVFFRCCVSHEYSDM